MNNNIILIGTGPMAVAYAQVLKAQKLSFQVIGRGIHSAERFENETGIKPATGGLSHFLNNNKAITGTNAIVATGTEMLMPTLLLLLRSGVNRILIEKPAALSIEELLENEKTVKPFSKQVFIAYNRRFYASVIEAESLIAADGGLQSMFFEFTEWSHKIEPLEKAKGVKENWFFANSTHVIDLAFFLAGKPKEWMAFSKEGSIKWHKKTNFSGAGITEKNVIFSYLSNWESAGRWSIELLTANRRIYLKPLEGIGAQLKGTIPVIEHFFDNKLDVQFKPGLYKQVEAFVNNNTDRLINIEDHLYITENVYKKMVG